MKTQLVYSNPVQAFEPWPEAPEAWNEAPLLPRGPGWVELPDHPSVETNVIAKDRKALFLDLAMAVDLPWEQTRSFEHCKLYWTLNEPFTFSEEGVVCFRITHQRKVQRVRILLPPPVMGAKAVRFRIDPFPYCSRGSFFVQSMRLVFEEDQHVEPSRLAVLNALKDSTNAGVLESDRDQVGVTPHYPNSMTIELTPKCNLTCSHCSSHGTPELHLRYNRMKEFSVEHLEKLADEAFPSMTEIAVVGRGEPTMVSERLWDTLKAKVIEHRVFLSVITNGYFVRKRITPDLLPHIGTLTFSIDGGSKESFAANRGGADFDLVMQNVAYFHQLRKEAGLLRRPRLCISWTFKRNNIAEFPRFLRDILHLDPDLIYARHLVLFFDKDRSQSLLGEAELVNRHLREAYALMAEHGIKTDCPPLMKEEKPAVRIEPPVASAEAVAATISAPPAKDGCMYIHKTAIVMCDGEVLTCPMPFVKVAGHLSTAETFWDIWNGPVMQGVRVALNTESEWEQCRNCWYREARYKSQRAARELGNKRYDLEQADEFKEKSWDYTGFKQ